VQLVDLELERAPGRDTDMAWCVVVGNEPVWLPRSEAELRGLGVHPAALAGRREGAAVMARTAGGQVIDFGRERALRRVEAQAVDLVAAWEARRAQLVGEAELAAREIGAHAAALDAAAARFAEAGRAAIARLGAIQQQIDDINTAIDHWRALAPDGGG
jgi:hypothetical protein